MRPWSATSQINGGSRHQDAHRAVTATVAPGPDGIADAAKSAAGGSALVDEATPQRLVAEPRGRALGDRRRGHVPTAHHSVTATAAIAAITVALVLLAPVLVLVLVRLLLHHHRYRCRRWRCGHGPSACDCGRRELRGLLFDGIRLLQDRRGGARVAARRAAAAARQSCAVRRAWRRRSDRRPTQPRRAAERRGVAGRRWPGRSPRRRRARTPRGTARQHTQPPGHASPLHRLLESIDCIRQRGRNRLRRRRLPR